MTYKTLMVHLDLSGDNEGVLKVAGDLAAQFDAKVIGIAAYQPIQLMVGEGINAGEAIAQERAEAEKELSNAAAEFHAGLKGQAKSVEWRSAISYGSLADYIADEARAADLIITGKDIGASLLDDSRRVNIGELAMRAGRPILIVPQGVCALSMRHVIVGWKETREARRAVADALPLLQAAAHATVLEVVPETRRSIAQGHVNDVAAWLEQHQVDVSSEVVIANGTEIGPLHAALLARKCDLLVAGAYGHNRLKEWVFGGVTMDMLLDPDFCVLISH